MLGRGSAGKSGVGGRVGNGKNELVPDTIPKMHGWAGQRQRRQGWAGGAVGGRGGQAKAH